MKSKGLRLRVLLPATLTPPHYAHSRFPAARVRPCSTPPGWGPCLGPRSPFAPAFPLVQNTPPVKGGPEGGRTVDIWSRGRRNRTDAVLGEAPACRRHRSREFFNVLLKGCWKMARRQDRVYRGVRGVSSQSEGWPTLVRGSLAGSPRRSWPGTSGSCSGRSQGRWLSARSRRPWPSAFPRSVVPCGIAAQSVGRPGVGTSVPVVRPHPVTASQPRRVPDNGASAYPRQDGRFPGWG